MSLPAPVLDADDPGVPLSRDAAYALTESIRAATTRVLDALADVERDVQRAYEGRAWSAMGYQSWEAYCATEFAATRMWQTIEERHQRVVRLHDAGLSQRAISAVLGVGVATINRDLSTVPSGAVDSPSQGIDGRARPARRLEDAQLLARRLEVLRLRDSGMSQQDVAARLRVSQATVSTDEKFIGEVLAELTEEEASRVETLAASGDPDLDVVAAALGIDALYNRFDVGDVLADNAGGKAKELRRMAKSLHDDAIFHDDVLVTDAECLRKTTVAALPALAEAVQTAARCLVPLDGRLLDDKSRARAADLVDLAISELRRWRERAG